MIRQATLMLKDERKRPQEVAVHVVLFWIAGTVQGTGGAMHPRTPNTWQDWFYWAVVIAAIALILWFVP